MCALWSVRNADYKSALPGNAGWKVGAYRNRFSSARYPAIYSLRHVPGAIPAVRCGAALAAQRVVAFARRQAGAFKDPRQQRQPHQVRGQRGLRRYVKRPGALYGQGQGLPRVRLLDARQEAGAGRCFPVQADHRSQVQKMPHLRAAETDQRLPARSRGHALAGGGMQPVQG